MSNNLIMLTEESGYITERDVTDRELRPGCLGKLKGPIAEWKDPTRNDHYYSKNLWVNVFNTPWVKEAIETHTLFGEADHPDDRLEPKLSEAAVVLTDYEFNDQNKVVYGSFDILDTPKGKILKTLANYGCRLGVSSRGRGSLIKQGSRSVVDPTTYLFGGFDVVAMPAVKQARQDYYRESVSEDTMTKDTKSVILEQIKSCNSVDDLNVIRNILSNANLIESFKHEIDSRVSALESKDNTIIAGLTNDLREAYAKNRELESKLNSATNTISIDESLDSMKFMDELLDENLANKDVIEALKSNIDSKINEINSLNSIIKESSYKVKTLTDQLNDSRSLHRTKDEDDHKYKDKLTEQVEICNQLEGSVTTLQESNNELSSRVDDLENQLNELSTELNETVDQYNELVNDYNDLLSYNHELVNKYLDEQASKVGLNSSVLIDLLPEDYNIDDIDRVIKSQINISRKLNKLPITESFVSHGESNTDRKQNSIRRINHVRDDLSSTVQILENMNK